MLTVMMMMTTIGAFYPKEVKCPNKKNSSSETIGQIVAGIMFA